MPTATRRGPDRPRSTPRVERRPNRTVRGAVSSRGGHDAGSRVTERRSGLRGSDGQFVTDHCRRGRGTLATPGTAARCPPRRQPRHRAGPPTTARRCAPCWTARAPLAAGGRERRAVRRAVPLGGHLRAGEVEHLEARPRRQRGEQQQDRPGQERADPCRLADHPDRDDEHDDDRELRQDQRERDLHPADGPSRR